MLRDILYAASALLLGACGPSQPPSHAPAPRPTASAAAAQGTAEPAATVAAAQITVRMEINQVLPQVRRALDQEAARAGAPGECVLAWGAVPPAGPSTWIARVAWPGGSLDGQVRCGADVDVMFSGERMRDAGMFAFRRGVLHAAHPSDLDDSRPVERVPTCETPPSDRTLAIFESTDEADRDQPAAPALDAIRDLRCIAAAAIWPFR
ncbi:hypothetical protein WME90_32775 [Sorangium sp. So ce375]|uniref:hypothetical protein n=1 Tax=Sorangium sp. So ce375 TaxID=3133306 RepID=UPI003F5C6FE2